VQQVVVEKWMQCLQMVLQKGFKKGFQMFCTVLCPLKLHEPLNDSKHFLAILKLRCFVKFCPDILCKL